ncbi:unnamed protein product [Boreogadus saida]
MDFNMKKLASGAGVFFTRAVQFTEERLGQAERTEPDAELERLAGRADVTRLWTERICRQTEVLLRPNPVDYTVSAVALIGPLRGFLEDDWSLITKERRLLENRRLDLDACKARLRRAQAAESKAAEVPLGQFIERLQLDHFLWPLEIIVHSLSRYIPRILPKSPPAVLMRSSTSPSAPPAVLMRSSTSPSAPPAVLMLLQVYRLAFHGSLLHHHRTLVSGLYRVTLSGVQDSGLYRVTLSGVQDSGLYRVTLSGVQDSGLYRVTLSGVQDSGLYRVTLSGVQDSGLYRVTLSGVQDSGLYRVTLSGTQPDFQETRPRNYVLSASASGLWTQEVEKAGDERQRAQAEFDQQAEVTKLLLGDISSTHVNHLRCLHEFVEAQAAYYKQCHLHMEDLQKELACGSAGGSGQQGAAGEQSGGGGDPPSPPPGSRRARVLFDYDAADASELSLYADQLITVYTVPGMDSDWLIGERENHRGRVPVTYLELLS